MTGRDPMKGRHAVGGRTGNAGKIRGGQGPSGSGVGTGVNQRTGVSPSSPSRSVAPKPGVLANQAKTSIDLQKRLSGKAPQPFTQTQGAATTPTPASPRGAKPGGESIANPRGVYSGKSGNTVTARALPSNGPIGQNKPINQSGQIGGRMGFPPPARKAGAQNLSKVKRNASFYGE